MPLLHHFSRPTHQKVLSPSSLNFNRDNIAIVIRYISILYFDQNKHRMQKEPIQEQFQEEVCFGAESPAKVNAKTIQQIPHSLIGAITMENDIREVGLGTGILLSPDLVLTSAHNLYLWKDHKMYSKFRFYPGQSGPLQKYYEIKSWYFPYQFLDTNVPTYDYALLRLAEKTTHKQFIPLKTNFQAVKEDQEIAIFGYSGKELVNLDPRDRYRLVLNQWGLIRGKQRLVEINKNNGYIIHKISTVKGQSGAPILLINNDGEMTIVGIHKGGIKRTIEGQRVNLNSGRLLTEQLLQILNNQADNLGAIPFSKSGNSQVSVLNSSKVSLSTVSESRMKEDFDDLLLEEGNTLLKQKKFKEAEQCFQWTLDQNPNHFQAQCSKARAQLEQQKYQEALQTSKKALSLNQNNAEAHSNMGWALWGIGQYQEAQASCKKALSIDPKCALAHKNMGSALYLCGRKEEAAECFRKAISIDPNFSHGHYNLGLTLASLGKQAEAVKCYQKAIEIDPIYKEAYVNLGIILKDLKKHKEAIQAINKALNIDPNFVYAHNALGSAYEDLGKTEEAITCYKKAIKNDPKFDKAYNNLAMILKKTGKKDEAKQFIFQAIELKPRTESYYNTLLSVMDQPKRIASGLLFLDRMKSEHPDSTEAAKALQNFST